jgi:hypothetical protein
MQHHDQVAELRGLNTERANYLAAGRTDRAEQVDRQIAGVRAALTDRIEQLRQRATIAAEQGAHVRAGEATEQARELEVALDETSERAESGEQADPDELAQELQEQLDEAAEGGEQVAADQPPAGETTAESAPRETATTRRPAKGKGA